MKYIVVYHANLNYSGLGPEKYEFVIRNSYERIIDMYNNELKGIPYCFEASGYTIEKIAEYCPDVLEKLLDASRKNCEILGSPYAHPMLPNFPYRDGLKSLEFTMEAFQKTLGFVPESGWWFPRIRPGVCLILSETGIIGCRFRVGGGSRWVCRMKTGYAQDYRLLFLLNPGERNKLLSPDWKRFFRTVWWLYADTKRKKTLESNQ